ncbi:MazG family protein [Qiania dongpingensis]|uniref:MazG family protein n=1 Tax=Qiania dongpingensis TaxID=2763669 RepID=A0A7G9G0J3_9FIRM|nr:MazG family protein [Qiania dongpingensis]QNM04325.1 MazG family protein [Qiania dongpingensis]
MEKKERYTFGELKEIIAELRSEDGCPWDRAQTHESMKKCLQDECEEVLQAIENKDTDNLCEELGDILFQVMLHSQIAEEDGDFTVEDVISMLCRKMIRRHPHVFGSGKDGAPEESKASWDEIKNMEKEARRKGIKL